MSRIHHASIYCPFQMHVELNGVTLALQHITLGWCIEGAKLTERAEGGETP